MPHTQITGPAQRLRAIAARAAASLLHDGMRAVAVTGSAGRGDATAGSDLDLWLIGEPERVTPTVLEGVPTTLMVEAPARVLDPGHLARVEVDCTFVVADPEGLFAAVLATWRAHAQELRARNIEGARARVAELLREARAGTPQGRLWLLREAAHVAAATRLLQDTGMMMPKMRHMRAHLDPESVALLSRIQDTSRASADLSALRAAASASGPLITAQLRVLFDDIAAVGPPDAALRKIDVGDTEDGVLQLRHTFKQVFIDVLLGAAPGFPVVAFLLNDAAPALRAWWQRIHGLEDDDAVLLDRVASTAADVALLLERLGHRAP